MPITVGGTSITFNDSTVQSTAFTGGGANVQSFSSSGTYTKPSGAKFVMVELWGAGGSANHVQICGQPGSTRTGGGGGGGAYSYRMFIAPEVCSTVPVTVGAGGAAVQGTDYTPSSGVNGNAGGDTTFGSLLFAGGGAGGKVHPGGYPQGSVGGNGGRVLQDAPLGRTLYESSPSFMSSSPQQWMSILAPRPIVTTASVWGMWSGGSGGFTPACLSSQNSMRAHGSVSLFGGGGGGAAANPAIAGNGGKGRVLGAASPTIQSPFAPNCSSVLTSGGGAPGAYCCYNYPLRNGLPFNGGGGGNGSFCGPSIPTNKKGGLAAGGGAPAGGGGNGYAVVYSW